jgi:hypothetical protein
MENFNMLTDSRDKIQVQNLIKLLAKCKIELEGTEIMIASDVYKWVHLLSQRIEEDQIPKQQVVSEVKPKTKKKQ